jgi:hypothetical protein
MLIEGAVRLPKGRSYVFVTTYRDLGSESRRDPLDLMPIGRASDLQRLDSGEVTADIELMVPVDVDFHKLTISAKIMPMVEIGDGKTINIVEAELLEVQYV